jgi:hypothetical protein
MQSTINFIKGISSPMVLLLAGVLLFLSSCQKAKKPEGVLSEQEIASLMVEMYVAEAKLNTIPVSRDSAIRLFQPFENSYLQKRKISDEVLKKTYRYYLERPAEFEKIYDSVIDTLNLREKRIQHAIRHF